MVDPGTSRICVREYAAWRSLDCSSGCSLQSIIFPSATNSEPHDGTDGRDSDEKEESERYMARIVVACSQSIRPRMCLHLQKMCEDGVASED